MVTVQKPIYNVQKADSKTSSKPRNRIWEIDFIRGMCILLMIVDHFMLDITMLDGLWHNQFTFDSEFAKYCNLAYSYFALQLRKDIRNTVLMLFFFTSGVSSRFSRSNLKRGLMLAIVAAGLTIFTSLPPMKRTFYIGFGVIHCYAACVLLYWLLRKLKVNKWALVVVTVFTIVFWEWIQQSNFQVDHDRFQSIGIVSPRYWAIDYFPIFPNFTLFLLGTLFAEAVYVEKKSFVPMLNGEWNKSITFVGKHALWFYVGHQIVFFGGWFIYGILQGYKTF